MLVGAFTPWITIRTLFGAVSATGMERGPGGFVLVVGLGLCGVGLDLLLRSGSSLNRSHLIGHRVITAGAAGYAWFSVQPSIDEAAAEGLVASYGVGLWVLTLGVFVAWTAASRVPAT